jgi:hypothetical protein
LAGIRGVAAFGNFWKARRTLEMMDHVVRRAAIDDGGACPVGVTFNRPTAMRRRSLTDRDAGKRAALRS